VTGGAGYIGSHACKSLAKAGYTPISYDNLIYGHEHAVKWGPLEIGNILDTNRLSAVFKKYQPSAVMHFAAYTYVNESVIDPLKYYENNLIGSLTVLNEMMRHNINKFIFSSSCATYGIPLDDQIDENHPQNPINPYGAAKLAVENILKDYNLAYGLDWISLRYFNAAGADPDGQIGEDHDPETHLIPLAITAAMEPSNILKLYGTDYNTPDGTCLRDYVHVCDIADAHVRALEGLENGITSQALNLGTGKGHSNLEVLSKVSKLCGRTVPYTTVARRQGDTPVLIANADRAEKILGWIPRYSNLDNILRTAIYWHTGNE
jgi:UDP-arabinose 4-epimerase